MSYGVGLLPSFSSHSTHMASRERIPPIKLILCFVVSFVFLSFLRVVCGPVCNLGSSSRPRHEEHLPDLTVVNKVEDDGRVPLYTGTEFTMRKHLQKYPPKEGKDVKHAQPVVAAPIPPPPRPPPPKPAAPATARSTDCKTLGPLDKKMLAKGCASLLRLRHFRPLGLEATMPFLFCYPCTNKIKGVTLRSHELHNDLP